MELILSFLLALITYFVQPVLSLLIIVVFINVILSLLISFNVINAHNQFVATVWRISSMITEPLLSPIRRFLPAMGGLDFSPLVLLLAIQFVQGWVIPQLIISPLLTLMR